MSDLSIIILSAGKGERMWPLTTTRPKPLLPILCKPLLDTHIDTIMKYQKDNLILVVHYNKEVLKQHLEKKGVSNKIEMIDQGQPLGTGHAVKKALEVIDTERTLIIYGDILVGEEEYEKLLNELIVSSENIIVGTKVKDPSRYGVLVKDESNALSKIHEKPKEPYPSNIVFSGILLVDTKSLREAVENTSISPRGEIELTDAIQQIARKTSVYIKEIQEMNWVDVGTPWDYMEANKIQLYNKCKQKGVPPHECIIGDNYIVEEPVVIEGPVFIGDNATIGPFTHVRENTIICDNAKIGFATQVKGSIIFENAKLPHLNYVGDSIIGEYVNLGAGTITANLRHDNKPIKTMLKGKLVSTGRRKFGTVIGGWSKTGINTTITPGTKIGAHTWIGSGCIVDRDIPDYSILKCSQAKEVITRRMDQ